MEVSVGSVVMSKAGRDMGKSFIVVSLQNADYAYISDGDSHKLMKPKLKKLKHLKPTGDSLPNIATKLLEGQQVFDAEIRSALRKVNKASDVEVESV